MKQNIDAYIDFYENAPIAYFSIGTDGLIKRCNPHAAEMLGYKVDDLPGRPVLDLYADTPDGKEKAKMLFEKFRSGQPICDEELQMQKADGSPIWISLSVNAIRDNNGRILASRSIAVDISHRKELEQVLAESELKFRSLAEESLVGIYLIQDNQFKYVNPKLAEIFGYTQHEVIGKMGPRDLVLRDDWPVLDENIRKRIDGEVRSIRYQLRGVKKDSAVIYIEVLGSLTSFQNKPAIIGTLVDVTEHTRLIRSLNYRLQFEHLISEISTDIINTSANRIDRALRKALQKIVNFLQCDSGWIFMFSDDHQRASMKLYWENKKGLADKKRVKELLTEQFPGLSQNLLKGKIVAISSLNQLAKSPKEKEMIESLGASSFISVPLVACQKTMGALCFANVHKERVWTEEEKNILKTIGKIIVNAFLRKESERELQESEKYFRSLLQNLHEDIFVLDRDYKIIDLNNPVSMTMDYRREDVLGKHCYEVSHDYQRPCDQEGEDCLLPQVFDTGESCTCHHVHHRKNGSKSHVDILMSPLKNEAGQVTRVIHASRDVSDIFSMHEKIKENEEKLGRITSTALDAIIMIDHEGKVTFWNEAATAMFGYSASKVSGKELHHLIVPDQYQQAFQAGFSDFQQTGKGTIIGKKLQVVAKRKDGGEFPVEISLSSIQLHGHWHAVGIIRDITEREQTRKELFDAKEKLRGILDASTEAIFAKDKKGYYQEANIAFLKLFGKTIDEIIGKTDYDLFGAEQAETIRAIDRQVIKDEKIVKVEDHLKIQGREHIFKVTKVPLRDSEGQVIGLAGFADDITEEKRVEQALCESEERYRKLVEVLPDGIFVNQDGRIAYMNPACARMLKIEEINKIIGTPTINIVPPENREKIQKRIQETMESGHPAPLIETQLVCYDGDRINVESTATAIVFDDQPALMVTIRDITDRKKAEKALQQEQHLMKMFMAHVPDAIYFKDLQGRFLRVNKAQAKRLGIEDPAEATGKTDFDFFSKDEAERSAQEHAQVTNTGKILSIEKPKKDIHGNVGWIWAIQAPLRDEEGNITGVLGVTRDITEKKRAEERLRQNELFLNTIFDSIQDGISVLDTDLNILKVNKVMNKWYASNIPLEGKKCYQCYHNRDHICNPCPSLRCLKSGNVERDIVPGLPGSDTEWLELFSYPIRDVKTGAVTGVVEFVRDITLQKRLEDDLLHERELLQNLMDNIPDTIYFKDRQSRFVRVNKAHAREFRIKSPQEAVGKTDFDFFSEEHARQAFEDEQRIMATGKPLINKVEKVTYTDREPRWVSSTKVPIRDRSGEVIGMVGISRDITKLKQMEESLRASERELRQIIDLVPDMIYAKDGEGRFLFVNKASARGMGLTVEQMTGKTQKELHKNTKEVDRWLAEDRQVIKTGKPLFIREEAFTDVNGHIRWLQTTKVPFQTPRTSNRAVLGISIDITEMKNIYRALEESEEMFRSISETAQDAVILTNSEGIVAYWNRAAKKIFGYSSRETIGKDVHELITPKNYLEKSRTGIRTFKKSGHGTALNRTLELTGRRKDGSLFPVELSLSSVKLHGEWHAVGIVRDITERKKAREQLENDLKEKEVLLKEVHHRVKNNMQVIKSLLSLQARQSNDPKFTEIINEAINRIHSMALVHEKMYQTGDFARIDFKSYIQAMAHDLFMAYYNGKPISTDIYIDNSTISLEKAIPCGLILNELITNALKYAFQHRENGKISIRLKSLPNHRYELVVADNGVGLPQGFKIEEAESLGLKLVNVLTEQIDGLLEIKRQNGTQFRILFPDT